MSAEPLLVAACALVDADGRVLLAQRPPGKPMAGCGNFRAARSSRANGPKTTLDPRTEEELGINVKEAVSRTADVSPATLTRISIF